MEREMTNETQELLQAAQAARTNLRVGNISYEEAREIVKKYIDHANEKGKKLAKEFGERFRPMSVTSFLR